MVITDVKRIKSASSGALSKSNSGVKSSFTYNCMFLVFFLHPRRLSLPSAYPALHHLKHIYDEATICRSGVIFH